MTGVQTCALPIWFSKVAVNDEGAMALDESQSSKGAQVTLRFEMDTLVLLHTCPHPLDNSDDYPKMQVQFELGTAEPVADDDICMNSRPENQRGFKNNALYHIGLGGTS